MAAFRNRDGKWQARVRRQGYAPITKSFITLQDAEKWARSIEVDLDKNSYSNTNLAEKTTFKDLIERYMREVTPSMRREYEDLIRLKAIARRPISQLNMLVLTPTKIAEYRDERLKQVSSGTVIRELSYLSSIINHARREWGINIANPVNLVKKPPTPKGRTRILSNEEKVRLMRVLEDAPKNILSIWMPYLVKFALETAMRQAEICTLMWANVDLDKRTAYLPITKNGESRYVPLSSAAIKILNELPRSIDGRVFPVNRSSVSVTFTRNARIANVENFRFHDLRHTAITAMAEKLPNVLELSAVTGHKTLSMLKRYTHFKAEDLAKKLG
ncbi:XerC Integrase [Methylophilaceae bacterium]